MKRRKAALGLPFGVAAALVLVARRLDRLGETQTKAAAFKAAWIYVGPHNDGGWSQAHDQGRLYVQKALGVEGADDVQGERPRRPAGRAGDREPRSATATRSSSRRRSGSSRAMVAAAKKHPDVKFEMATGTTCSRRTWPSTSAPARTRSTCPAWRPARRRRRASIGYVVAVRDPRGDPARERVRARRAGDASRAPR